MSIPPKKKTLFTVGTLLGSFFGAAMVAASFAYFNYKFAEYKSHLAFFVVFPL
jgi:hypothetical protein